MENNLRIGSCHQHRDASAAWDTTNPNLVREAMPLSDHTAGTVNGLRGVQRLGGAEVRGDLEHAPMSNITARIAMMTSLVTAGTVPGRHRDPLRRRDRFQQPNPAGQVAQRSRSSRTWRPRFCIAPRPAFANGPELTCPSASASATASAGVKFSGQPVSPVHISTGRPGTDKARHGQAGVKWARRAPLAPAIPRARAVLGVLLRAPCGDRSAYLIVLVPTRSAI